MLAAVERVRNELSSLTGKEPTAEEIAKVVGVSAEETQLLRIVAKCFKVPASEEPISRHLRRYHRHDICLGTE
jgi:DNA-directed RNA polymerase specialized sigma subunit